MEKSKLMKLHEVMSETKMGKTKVYRMIKEGKFPAQIGHGGSVVWARRDVDIWVDCLITGEKYGIEKVA